MPISPLAFHCGGRFTARSPTSSRRPRSLSRRSRPGLRRRGSFSHLVQSRLMASSRIRVAPTSTRTSRPSRSSYSIACRNWCVFLSFAGITAISRPLGLMQTSVNLVKRAAAVIGNKSKTWNDDVLLRFFAALLRKSPEHDTFLLVKVTNHYLARRVPHRSRLEVIHLPPPSLS